MESGVGEWRRSGAKAVERRAKDEGADECLLFCVFVLLWLCAYVPMWFSTFPRRPMALKTRQHHSAALSRASFPYCASFPLSCCPICPAPASSSAPASPCPVCRAPASRMSAYVMPCHLGLYNGKGRALLGSSLLVGCACRLSFNHSRVRFPHIDGG